MSTIKNNQTNQYPSMYLFHDKHREVVSMSLLHDLVSTSGGSVKSESKKCGISENSARTILNNTDLSHRVSPAVFTKIVRQHMARNPHIKDPRNYSKSRWEIVNVTEKNNSLTLPQAIFAFLMTVHSYPSFV